MLTFGFGDTFTSLLVFSSGGYESNFIVVALLRVFGANIVTFMAIKIAATLVVIMVGKLAPKAESFIAAAMLGVGLFLSVHNLLHYLAASRLAA